MEVINEISEEEYEEKTKEEEIREEPERQEETTGMNVDETIAGKQDEQKGKDNIYQIG